MSDTLRDLENELRDLRDRLELQENQIREMADLMIAIGQKVVTLSKQYQNLTPYPWPGCDQISAKID